MVLHLSIIITAEVFLFLVFWVVWHSDTHTCHTVLLLVDWRCQLCGYYVSVSFAWLCSFWVHCRSSHEPLSTVCSLDRCLWFEVRIHLRTPCRRGSWSIGHTIPLAAARNSLVLWHNAFGYVQIWFNHWWLTLPKHVIEHIKRSTQRKDIHVGFATARSHPTASL